eukprot:CAMPEP_0203920016 /NCGR_PEP_ID=MMETSP0359-20131031/60361_1 /ASSEMBLY_ACC=CAM_ASM_000338 /TAXON_ID=268821 /ORGANISM="Scrippsiella Hangoei, Strain SHTV-5" /LENGTH=83 /DNA_ID=CAMNT_0050847423 /DNA_START=127 /DNA_END=378 /DNA_ORIENTATION=+
MPNEMATNNITCSEHPSRKNNCKTKTCPMIPPKPTTANNSPKSASLKCPSDAKKKLMTVSVPFADKFRKKRTAASLGNAPPWF